MTFKFSIPTILCLALVFSSCTAQDNSATPTQASETVENKVKKPHKYGGWYCPDNFGFTPVDIRRLDEVPAISDRLPSEEELHNHESLINVDLEKHPDARALKMDLPRVASIFSESKGLSQLVIVIQAIVVSGDTVVGYRFANGGNGSAWLSEVNFLSEQEVSALGSRPFFYSKSVLKASKENIWKAISQTAYAKGLGIKFDQAEFFASEWDSEARIRLELDTLGEKAWGYVGMVYGNAYLHIDYDRNGFHYSEKLLLIENHEDNTTELFFACGPFPEDFESEELKWKKWVEKVVENSES